jgi:hypothetical protein
MNNKILEFKEEFETRTGYSTLIKNVVEEPGLIRFMVLLVPEEEYFTAKKSVYNLEKEFFDTDPGFDIIASVKTIEETEEYCPEVYHQYKISKIYESIKTFKTASMINPSTSYWPILASLRQHTSVFKSVKKKPVLSGKENKYHTNTDNLSNKPCNDCIEELAPAA